MRMTDPLEQRRKEAMKRYLKGEKVTDICHALSCSTSFLYRWLHRFNAANTKYGWEKSRSRRPAQCPLKTPLAICQEIVRLEKERARNGQTVGAASFIQQALKQKGLLPVPSSRTIYRILARHEKEGNEATTTE